MSHSALLRNLELPPHNEELLYRTLSDFLRGLPIPCHEVPELVKILRDKEGKELYRTIISLFILELWIYFPSDGPNREMVDKLIKSLSHLSPTSLGKDQKHSFATIKYYDLATDYQYLFGSTSLKLAELMTKKLTMVSSVHDNSTVVNSISLKTAILYVLCDSDHSKDIIKRCLQQKGTFEALPEELSSFVAVFLTGRLVPLEEYTRFVEYLKKTQHEFSAALRIQAASFFANFLDSNIHKLSKYYLTITFSRVQSLLTNDTASIEIEDFLYNMVIPQKLLAGIRIDQVNKVVHFGGEPTKYDNLNTRTKAICDLMNSL